jgi:hypothetical protein
MREWLRRSSSIADCEGFCLEPCRSGHHHRARVIDRFQQCCSREHRRGVCSWTLQDVGRRCVKRISATVSAPQGGSMSLPADGDNASTLEKQQMADLEKKRLLLERECVER